MSDYINNLKERITDEKEKIILNKMIDCINFKFNNKREKLNENEIDIIRHLPKSFTFNHIEKSINECINQYIRYDNENKIIEATFQKFINKLSGICFNLQKHIIDQRITNVINLCNRKWKKECNKKNILDLINEILLKLVLMEINENKIAEFFGYNIYMYTYRTKEQEKWIKKMNEIITNLNTINDYLN